MKNTETLIARERQVSSLLWGSFLFLAVTGLIGWTTSAHSSLIQWVSLVHGLAGILFALSVVVFGYLHFRRTLGFRRPVVLLIGLLAWLVFLSCAYTGLHILIEGRREAEAYLYDVHLYSGAIAAVLLLTHLISHYWLFPKKHAHRERFPTLEPRTRRRAAWTATAFTLLLGSAWGLSLSYDPAFTTESIAGSYEYSYGDHPFRPSHTETPHGGFIDNRQIANSSECVVCHADVAKEWIDSTHKKAASDPAYMRNVNLLAERKDITATRYCEGCHAPIALLTGALTPGGYHGGQIDTDANREGVNCMSCHGVYKLEHFKGVASYHFKPTTPYLFEGSEHPFLRAINRLSIKLDPSQHKRDLANDILAKPEFCASCHAQFMDKDMNGWGWVKTQDDYSAWLDSPYSGQNPRFSAQQRVICHDCHMPLVPTQDPSANAQGKTKSHRFVAANSMLALLSEDSTQYDHMVRFMQSNKITVTIEEPHRDNATQTYFHLESGIRDQINLPWYVYLNEEVNLNLTVSNVGVGHNFPGGTIDLNEAWVELVVTDAQGQEIFSSGLMNEGAEVDPNAYFYRAIPVDRSGKHVWRHDLFNMIGESFRNVIPPGGSDTLINRFRLPSWAISPLTVSAAVKYRKFNKRYSDWALEDEKIRLPVIDMARHQLNIPVKHQPEVHLSTAEPSAPAP